MVDKWETEGYPKRGRIVMVWLQGKHLPFLGYMKLAAGCKDSPQWIVYCVAENIKKSPVVAWCDCLPKTGPKKRDCKLYEGVQA